MVKKIILRSIKIILLAFACLWLFTMKIGNIATGSMEPNLNIGESVLYCKLFPLSKVEKGDIVVYKPRPDFPVVHRVHEVQYTMDGAKLVRKLRVKGDNNLFVDSVLVDKSNYVGKVIYVIKNPKVNAFLKAVSDINGLTRAGIILMIVTIWLLVIGYRVVQAKAKQPATDMDNTAEECKTEQNDDNNADNNNDNQSGNNDWFDL